MTSSDRLNAFLKSSKVKYSVLKHPLAYTAQEIAASQHVPGRQLAKSVLAITNSGPVLAVLPSMYLIDFKKLKNALRVTKLSLAREADVKRHFPDIEIGAMSPFGNLYNIPVIADETLAGSDTIVFNAGSHTETISMRYQDFIALVKPKTGRFSRDVEGKEAASRKKPAAGKKTGGSLRSKRAARAKKKKTNAVNRRKQTAKTKQAKRRTKR